MWRSVPALAAVLLLIPATAARAGDDAPMLGKAGDFTLTPPEVGEAAAAGWYVRGDVGYAAGRLNASSASPLAQMLIATADARASGWSIGAGLGYRFTPWLRAEVSLDYLDLGGVDTIIGHFSGSSTLGLASLYWDIIDLSGFTPYLSGGVGFAIDQITPPAALGAANDQWEFAWSLGAGVSYAVNSNLAVDLGYRYVSLGDPSLPGTLSAGLDGVAAHQLRIGLRYSFGE